MPTSKKQKKGNKKATQRQWVAMNLPGKGSGSGGKGQQPPPKTAPKPPTLKPQVLTWAPLATVLDEGQALTAEHLNATALGGAVLVYTSEAGEPLKLGSKPAGGPLKVSVTCAATPTHAAPVAPLQQTFTVRHAQVLAWTPASVELVYGEALEPKHLNATALGGAVPVYTNANQSVIKPGARPPAGEHTVTVTCEATPTHAAPLKPAAVTFKVAKAKPEITWANPPSVRRTGDPAQFVLGDAQLNAKLVKGESKLAYQPTKGSTLEAGIHFLRVIHLESANYQRGDLSVRLVVYNTEEAQKGFDKTLKGEGFKTGKGLSEAERKRWDDDEGQVRSKGRELMKKMQAMTIDEMVDLMNREVTDVNDRHDQPGQYPNKMWKFANGLQVRVKPKGDAHDSAPKFCIEIVDESVRTANRFTAKGEQSLIKAKLSIDGEPAPTGPNDTDMGSYAGQDLVNYTTGSCRATHPTCRAKLPPRLAWDKPPAIELGVPLERGVHLNARIVGGEGEGEFTYDPVAGAVYNAKGVGTLKATLPESKRYLEGRIEVKIDVVEKPKPPPKPQATPKPKGK